MKNIFPLIRKRKIHYLDSAATTQKPKIVIDAIKDFYEQHNANTHRGIYALSEEATTLVEESRKIIATFINATPQEIIFVRNTTEGINQIANALSKTITQEDNIIASIMEHHSNFVPWQQLTLQQNAHFKIIDVNPLTLDLKDIKIDINKHTKIVAITAMSNVTGAIIDVKRIIEEIKSINPQTIIVVDAAQAIAHIPIDVKDIGCDFLVFSMHKAYGPHIGIIYGKKQILESMNPFFYGGNMIHEVSIEKSTWADIPEKFEAGTLDSAGIYASGIAINYLENNFEKIRKKEEKIKKYALKRLSTIPEVIIVGHSIKKTKIYSYITEYGPLISFTIKNIHPHDLASVADKHHVCIRTGNHCAHPFMNRLGIAATIRLSIGAYTKKEDIDRLIIAIKDAQRILYAK